MEIRQAETTDLPELLALYTQFRGTLVPAIDDNITDIWSSIISDIHHHVIVATVDEHIVASCVLLIVPNLTHDQRPYALIENVITDKAHRNKGFASTVLNHAKKIAEKEHCYKIMLLTGSKLESTLKFYERCGFNRNDKTGFVLWLD